VSVDSHVTPDLVIAPPPLVAARCPHIVFRDVLGAERVAALLAHVSARRDDFTPAMIRNRRSGERLVDRDVRDCLYLRDLGVFEEPIKAFVSAIADRAVTMLGLIEPCVEPTEFEIAAYGDGGRFGAHIDTDERLGRVRVLSCVYYFAATPRRFSGGELRLYGFPTLSRAAAAAPSVDIHPDADTLVVFPSWLRHEVLPVRVPSGAWADGRFTINCWIHRLSPSPGTTGAS
jgi:Rps23 Pro-64 3,4-dihydroxylase Tpa1-like proline 4-hydroxylase